MRAAPCALFAVAAAADTRPWMNTADSPEDRAKKLVKEMTTDEKLSLFHGSCGGYTGNVCGIGRLGIPQQKNNDGPQGFRGATGTTTSWPAALTVAAQFDVEQMREWGEAMGDEFYRKGANIQLGPGACVARVPRNGRNFEYLSGEDPYLGYHMAAAAITGIQSKGVIANVKHYVNNNQETQRGSISENVDERTQFEIYYPPFEGASKAGLGSIMCSYNKICQNCGAGKIGNWSCENPETLQRDLKDRIGFKGWVMSDWGATHSASMNAGLDQEMPGSGHMGSTLAGMVKSGEVSMAKVDDSATRILWPFFAVGLFDKNNTNVKSNNVTSPEHNALARKISADATVLLKNDGVLPIGSGVKKIAIIGSQAQKPTVHGGGSGHVDGYYAAAPLDSIRAKLGIPPAPPRPNNCSEGHFMENTDVYNQDGQTSAGAGSPAECCGLCAARGDCLAFTLCGGTCWMKSTAKNIQAKSGCTSGIAHSDPAPPGQDCKGDVCVTYHDGGSTSEAANAAAAADVALVFVGTSSSEGGDRGNLGLGSQDALIAAVAAKAGKKTVVVAVTPGALLTPWRGDVAAVVTPLMPGQEYGNAITDVLFGAVNPSGRLPITFPSKENEVGFTQEDWPGKDGYATYSERLEVGYRWYAAHDVKPAYPFGHGLSYTTFDYSDLKTSGRTVSCTVKNSGSTAGKEVVQLYLKFPDSAGEPPKQLKGFTKLSIAAGASATATFTLDDRSFSIWDDKQHAWSVVAGSFGVMVGASSGDIRLTGTVSS